MKRLIDYFLQGWKRSSHRKPLLLRGARQIGKTHSVRALGKTFTNFVEINLETNDEARAIIGKDLDPLRMVRQLSELLQVDITPGTTLLFFDEIQKDPQTITALRYFYEQIPDLHIIAAGSLLDFAIEQVGIPVGRVSSLYMYPLSFIEFLVAQGNIKWAQEIISHTPTTPLLNPVHAKLLELVGEYLVVGGMPEAVNQWIAHKTSRMVKIVHSELLDTYQQDFGKYAKKHQIKYLNLVFQRAAEQLSNKFMYTRVGEYQKRELEPALNLLEMAGIVHRITKSAGQGIPLGAQVDPHDFKVIFLDVGLTQSLLKLESTPFLIDPLMSFINKGELLEAFVGQELLAYSDPITRSQLFYWRKDARGSDAELDFLIQLHDKIAPIEVKAGKSKRIKSMQIFLETHLNSHLGIRFSSENYSMYQKIHSYPLYAVAGPLAATYVDIKNALEFLTTT